MQNYPQFMPYQNILAEHYGKGFSEAEVTDIVRQVLTLLTQWHDQGQAYGFISLETIAYDHSSQQVLLLQGSQLINGYVAPEVAASGVSPAGDIYALGVAITVLLTAQPPEALRNLDGSWNWSDRCVISDQLESVLNIAIADYAPPRFADARQMLAVMFPQSVPSTVVASSNISNNQQSNSSKSAPLGIAIGVVMAGLVGFGVSSLLKPPQPNVNNSVVNTPSPNIQTTVTAIASPITKSPTPNTSPTPSQSPTPSPSPTNPFENERYPKSACGDPLPTDNGSSISLYPVFVDYSDIVLQQIQSQFCQDALAKVRKGTNRRGVQVASFTSRDRASLFAALLSKRFKGVEVGEPTIITPSSRSSSISESVVVSSDRVDFAGGSNSATVSGNVSSSQKRQYVLNCGSGQQFNAALLQGQANLRLIDPNGATVASGSNSLSVKLPRSGDYTVEVSAFDPISFNLRIEVL